MQSPTSSSEMVTGRQQITNKDGETINLKEDDQSTSKKGDNDSTRKEKEQSGKDTAGSSLPGHQNPGKPKDSGDLHGARE